MIIISFRVVNATNIPILSTIEEENIKYQTVEKSFEIENK
jgi:hypothetical protein